MHPVLLATLILAWLASPSQPAQALVLDSSPILIAAGDKGGDGDEDEEEPDCDE